tara:strand:+ start:1884 stop:3332 length:1449 start_codon:yes stop_codon:yes gene_type:complete
MDERTINEFGIDGFTLMEIAGTKAADFIQSKIPEESIILFLCGKGNNAGDALVVARILSQKGYHCKVCFLSRTDDLSPNAQKNLTLLKKLNENISFSNLSDIPDFNMYDIIIDGMLGTGLNSDVREPYNEVIQRTKEVHGFMIFSMDIPTGLNADNGRIMGAAVKADYTLTFGALKAGFYLNEGFDLSGEIILCELPFPNHFKEKAAYLIDENWVNELGEEEKKRAHKYDGGVLYVIAGSEGLTGAAVLACKSAWATGIGAVVLITPKGLLEIYEKNLIQIIKKPVGNNQDVIFSEKHLKEVLTVLSEKAGNLLIGPGLGRTPETSSFIQQLLSEFEGDVVLDADALFALSRNKDWEKPSKSNWILTPHPGELKTLLGSDISDDFDRLIQVTQFSKQKEVTVLSKGFPGILATTSGDAYLTGYDTRIFSRAGFGDVLAGKVSAYLLITKNNELACIHSLLHGKKKSISKNEHSHSLEPLDLI